MRGEIAKNMLSEAAGTIIEKGFNAVAIAAGFPEIALAVPIAKGLVLGSIENCYNDFGQRTMSKREMWKLDQVNKYALLTFKEMADKDGVVAMEMNIDPAYEDYFFEVAEHVTMEAIRQSEIAKVEVLGRYYGSQFYRGSANWQDMHQIITMVSALTFRQIVLIRLISEGFNGIDKNLYVRNPSACVEINRLLDYGIWKTGGALLGVDDSRKMKIDSISPTTYSEQVSKELMLDKLSNEDLGRTVDSLWLT